MSKDWEDGGNPWTVKSVSCPFENAWIRVESHKVIRPDGADGDYTVIRARRHAVGVLPFEADGRLHLVGQWRFPLGRYSWEMPEGGAEPDETPLACAQRELEEETGLSAGAYQSILKMDLSNMMSDESAEIFIATDLRQGIARPEGVEVLKRQTAPFAEVLARVVDGRIRDSLTVAGVLRAHHMAVTGQLPKPLAEAMLRPAPGGSHG